MVKDAESHAEEDTRQRALVEARNAADALVHATEQQLGEHGDKVEPDVKSSIETAMSDLREARDGEDVDAIQTATQALTQAAMKLGEAIYRNQQEPPTDGADGDDGVVDADFEEVDDDRKSGTA